MLVIRVSMVVLVPIMDHHFFALVLLGLQESVVKKKVCFSTSYPGHFTSYVGENVLPPTSAGQMTPVTSPQISKP